MKPKERNIYMGSEPLKQIMVEGKSLFSKGNLADSKKKQSFFAGKKPINQLEDQSSLSNDISSLSSRIRIIEERYDTLRRKTQVTDQNMLMNHRKLINENKIMHDSVTEFKREIAEIKEKITMIIKDLNDTARKEDITVIQKYINLWEPVQFITRNEAKNIIKDLLEEQKES